MQKTPLLLTLFLALSLGLFAQTNATEFSKGVNLTNWFQAPSVRQIDFSKYSKKDFENIKSLGANTIRLPINLHAMVGPKPEYQVDSLLYFFLDQVVDWAEELELNLILDNHSFDPIIPTSPSVGEILVPVWTQLARHFEPRSTRIYYEVLNEPHGITNSAWNAIQLDVINAIRSVDTTHTIIVGPSDFNGLRSLRFMPEYQDNNLIYTFHFYDPFVLTHQGASWTDPSMVNLGGIPFPYDATKMPNFPASLAGTWVQSAFNNYRNEGNAAKVKEYLDIAVDFATTRGVKIFCGEFGVYAPKSDNESRAIWYKLVSEYLTENGLSWTIWDYQGGFGIFNQGTNELFDHDINVPLVEALGFTVPPQSPFVGSAETEDIVLYTDFTASGVVGSHNINTGQLDFYNTIAVNEGGFSIYWTEAAQYNHVGFDFVPNKDLSLLVLNDYELAFDVRGLNAGSFDLRFLDTKTAETSDRPWRMNKRMLGTDLVWDGNWQEVVIPLSEFTEMGSWYNNTWFNPQGDFDWKAVDVFQIVAESGPLTNTQLWFDNIRIQGNGVITSVNEARETEKPIDFKLNQNYPNPFNPTTTIGFELMESAFTTLKIYDALGREITTLISGVKSSGMYSQTFNASGLNSGVYFYELKAGSNVQRKKMLLIK